MFTNSQRVPEIDSKKTSKKYLTGGLLALTLIGLSVFGGQQMGLFKGAIFEIKDEEEYYIISDSIINTGICTPLDDNDDGILPLKNNERPIDPKPQISIMNLPDTTEEALINNYLSIVSGNITSLKTDIPNTIKKTTLITSIDEAITKINTLATSSELNTLIGNLTPLKTYLLAVPLELTATQLTTNSAFLEPYNNFLDPIKTTETAAHQPCPSHNTFITLDLNELDIPAGSSPKIKVKINNSSAPATEINANELALTKGKQLAIINWSGYCASTVPAGRSTPCNLENVDYKILITNLGTGVSDIEIFSKTIPLGEAEVKPEFTHKNQILTGTFSEITSTKATDANGIFNNIIQSLLINAQRYSFNLNE